MSVGKISRHSKEVKKKTHVTYKKGNFIFQSFINSLTFFPLFHNHMLFLSPQYMLPPSYTITDSARHQCRQHRRRHPHENRMVFVCVFVSGPVPSTAFFFVYIFCFVYRRNRKDDHDIFNMKYLIIHIIYQSVCPLFMIMQDHVWIFSLLFCKYK